MQVQSGSSSLPKNEQKQRSQKACRYVRHSRKSLRRLSGQTRKCYSEESRDDNADSTDRRVPLKQYDPKLIRARSWFEGVSTPSNEKIGVYGRKLRSNKHQGQVHPNVKRKTKTSPTWRERQFPIIHMMQGKDGLRKKLGEPTTVLRTDTISKAATKEGVVH